MSNKVKEITKYFRSAVAAQVNRTIDFKNDNYSIVEFEEFNKGRVKQEVYANFIKQEKNHSNKDSFNVIIAVKTIRTIFDSQVKKSSDIDDLTAIFFMPAVLMKDGTLRYVDGKLPWIPREYLQPMIESTVSIGNYEDYDKFLSDNLGRIYKINSWSDYIGFAADLYEKVTNAKFYEFKISDVELETNIYILKDDTVNATFSIINLYDHMISEYKESKLYENFVRLKHNELLPLIPNDVMKMNDHCGQMGGEHPLSSSQRECINHFTSMTDGEILAVNGPPGTGKTALLQSIVANMYVERALNKDKAPIIVAASTNNQAVTNIIESFGKIKIIGYENLEQRWIEGVNSFAVYFPSSNAEYSASKKGYHFTDKYGHNFISDVENDGNINKSIAKILENCNEYFDANYSTINQCKERLYTELRKIDEIRKSLLAIYDKFENYNTEGKTIEQFLQHLNDEKKKLESEIKNLVNRVEVWRKHFNDIPIIYRVLRFIKIFRRKIENSNRLFIEAEEDFLNEYMTLDDIEEKYSHFIKNVKSKQSEAARVYNEIDQLNKQYQYNIELLRKMKINVISQKDGEENKEDKGIKSLNDINETMDVTLRYVEFWLSVHYYECRWAEGEDKLTERQKGATYENVLIQLFNRLSMITPCYVMTFYQLPKVFNPQDNGKFHYLYNFIDLLIVDEAGQVSPEIAACSFALAKKSIIVGDIHQIEPVWSISEVLDKSLAIENGIIDSADEFENLSTLGLNASGTNVMVAAAKSCKYKKFDDRGLFLSEHRRCYDEIISYCNELVYSGKLEPYRGKGSNDKEYKLKCIPQMGYMEIISEYSSKKGGSRYNKVEFVVGVGVLSEFGKKGYSGLKVEEIFADILFDNGEYNPNLVTTQSLPTLLKHNKGSVPIYKYISMTNVDLPEAVINEIKDNYDGLLSRTILNNKKRILYADTKLKDVIQNNTPNKSLAIIPLLQKNNVDTELLGDFLREFYKNNTNILTGENSADKTNFKRLIRIYDWLKYYEAYKVKES